MMRLRKLSAATLFVCVACLALTMALAVEPQATAKKNAEAAKRSARAYSLHMVLYQAKNGYIDDLRFRIPAEITDPTVKTLEVRAWGRRLNRAGKVISHNVDVTLVLALEKAPRRAARLGTDVEYLRGGDNSPVIIQFAMEPASGAFHASIIDFTTGVAAEIDLPQNLSVEVAPARLKALAAKLFETMTGVPVHKSVAEAAPTSTSE